MWIERLRLENFKGFDHFDLTLDRQLTVLAGVNGAGKTSVLDGLAVAMGTWFLGFDDMPQRSIAPGEVRVEEHVVRAQRSSLRSFERQYPVSVEAHGEVGAAGVFWKRTKKSDAGKTTRVDAGQLVPETESPAASPAAPTARIPPHPLTLGRSE